MIISRSVYVAASGIISFFLWPNSISLYIFIHSSVSGPLGCFYTLAIVTYAFMNMDILLSIYPEVELLDHMVILFFVELPYCFPQQLHHFTFLPVLANTYYFLGPFLIAILISVRLLLIL